MLNAVKYALWFKMHYSCKHIYEFLLICSLMFQMGIADAILDLVSSGTTLRENNLKEIEGGVVLQSQVLTQSGGLIP